MSEGPAETNPGSQENLTPQQAWGELLNLMRQIPATPPEELPPNYRWENRVKTFEDGKTMHLVRIREGEEWFITATVYPPGDIGDFLDTFSIEEGFGLWAGQLNSSAVSIGGQNVSMKESIAFSGAPGFSVTGTGRITFPRNLVPLTNIVDWVKSNVESSKYVPFPPITLSSQQGSA